MWVAPLTAFAASLLIVWWLATGRFAAVIVDRPNARSLHDVAVPRTGGLGLLGGALIALGIIVPALPGALWIAFAMMLAISLLDDLKNIAPAMRLTVHLGACGLFAATALGELDPALIAVLAVLCAWMANLYNFMDGSDGLAGGMTAAGFSFYGVAAWLAGDAGFALLCISFATAALGFLVFNFHPARIFLGDVGSVPIGFLAGALGALGWLHGYWSWWFPALVFGPFVADASMTLARRMLRMERVWEAHREHYYQRLVSMGWGHRKTAIAEYGVMVASGAAALAGLKLPEAGQWTLLAAISLVYLVFMVLIDLRWRGHRASSHS